MSDIAIRVEGLGKQYRIGKTERHDTLRDQIQHAVTAPFRKAASMFGGDSSAAGQDQSEIFWALKDVSFEVPRGSVLGVIGRNGAGKSTLLKILSRITEPTEGHAEIHGRVGSLLEVGTGFHGELSGRDNIFLNGAILGMKRAEIARKFDEIVAFAEVEKFIDTPVKHYSSGMYMRLAFAVAAHLEPEILIVDEVLAVGDAAFQKKCIGKMGDVAKHGRTILFVSHNLPTIERLCSNCVLLRQGLIEASGNSRAVISRYASRDLPAGSSDLSLVGHAGRTAGSLPLMKHVRVIADGVPRSAVRMGGSLAVEVTFENELRPMLPYFGIVVKTAMGGPVFTVNNRIIRPEAELLPVARGIARLTLRDLPLMAGLYMIDLYLGDQHGDLDCVMEPLAFEVVPADVFGTGKLPGPECGPIFCDVIFQMFEDVEAAAVGLREIRGSLLDEMAPQ